MHCIQNPLYSPYNLIYILYSWVVVFSHSVVSDSLWPHGLQHIKLPCISPSPRACTNSCTLSQSCHPTSHPLESPSSAVFSLSQHRGLFKWVSSSHQLAKGLELQLQHQSFQWIFRNWFPLELTGWISLQSTGLSRVFSNTTVQKHQFLGTQLSLLSNSHIHTWVVENYSLD